MSSSDREPAAWESGAAGPFATIASPVGDVTVWALGGDRFRIKAPGGEHEVRGHDEAMRLAHELADGPSD